MAGRQSAVQEVVELPATDALLLAQHDEIFHEGQALEIDSASSEEDLFAGALAAEEPSSNDGENLEDLDPADRNTASLGDAQRGKKRKGGATEPKTLEKVLAELQSGCKSAGDKNCCVQLPPEQLLEQRRMTEELDTDMRETFLAGKLHVLMRRGHVSHAGQVTGGAAERQHASKDYLIFGVKVCREVFLYANTSVSRYVLHQVQSHVECGCVVPLGHGLAGEGGGGNHGMH